MYNVLVGVTGLGTLVYANGLELLLGHGLLPVPWQAVAAYGILANVCYSFGSIAENLAERWIGRPVYGLGPALFRYGLVFSVGLTLLPAVLVTLVNVAGWLFAR